jgi:hypothetical protein
MLEYKNLNPFTQAYIDAIFFTDASEDNPEFEGLGFGDFAHETITKILHDCALFEMLNYRILAKAGTPEQNGHDFWLTRNSHGAGFWDRGYPKEVSDTLTDAAKKCGELHLVKGDNDFLYLE